MNIQLYLTYLITTLLTALKFFNSLHFPFDKLRILLSFLLTHLRSFRRSVGDMSFFRAGFERTENAICAEIVVVFVVVQISNVTDILFELKHPKDMPHAHAPIHLCCVRNYDSLMNPQQGDAILREQVRSSSSRNASRDLARRLKISQLSEPFKV